MIISYVSLIHFEHKQLEYIIGLSKKLALRYGFHKYFIMDKTHFYAILQGTILRY